MLESCKSRDFILKIKNYLNYDGHSHKFFGLTLFLDICMRFLGQLIKTFRFQKNNFAKFIDLIPTSPIMADSLKSSIPQTRVLLESEVDEPAHKKLRLDDDHGKEADIDSGMDDAITSTSQPTKTNGMEQKLKKKKNKKRKEPPLPEMCSAPDVLYQEIRSILGRDVVDRITSEGGAFKSPYSRGDEVEVTIDRMSAGGKFKVLPMKNLAFTSPSLGSGIGLASRDKGPWAIIVPLALPGEKARVRIGKNDRMHSTGEVLEMLIHNPDLRDNSRIKCKYFGTCAGCQYQVPFSIQPVFSVELLLICPRCCLAKPSSI